MKILNPKVHGVLDYVVVVLFLAAPSVFGFAGMPAKLSYGLAGVHLLVTIFTKFPLGLVKLLPFTIHGLIEFVVSFALMATPWLLGFASDLSARNFYVGTGVLFLVVWVLTDYKQNYE